MADPTETVTWQEDGGSFTMQWQSETGLPPPTRIEIVDDTTTADAAYLMACAGTAMLWRGDYHNARQLLQAVARRFDRPSTKRKKPGRPLTLTEQFHLHRQVQAQRARALGRLLLPFNADHTLSLRRAPDVRAACQLVYGERTLPYVATLRELLGILGAHQWRDKGVAVAALGTAIHPHYGVFAPVRGEYVDLVAQAPLADLSLAFDIGTGTGVLAAVLLKRGMQRVVATDRDPRALACAADNLARLELADRAEVVDCDLFPPGQAPLIVCNPPWLPGKPSSALEQAIYDPDSRMLRGFLAGLAAHLTADGQGWLILSDLAEHLGLRSRETLLGWMAAAGLVVERRDEAKPRHPKAQDAQDPLHVARVAEVTGLWVLRRAR